MDVHLLTFSKRENSTAQPTVSGNTPFSGKLREPCDIMSPSIGFNFTDGRTYAPAYNYAYIPGFSRYYFIASWSFSEGLWWASMHVDALASWKTAIGNSSQYIVRSSYTYDGSVTDTLYPVKNGTTRAYTGITDPWSGSSATYILGVLNYSGSGTFGGAVSYYAITQLNLRSLMAALMSDVDWTGFVDGDSDLTESVYKSLFNPLQYIVSCMYSPIANPPTGAAEPLTLGWWTPTDAGGNAIYVSPISASVTSGTLSVSIPKHPQAATRGKFLDASPYTRYTVYFPGFGTIPLDTSLYIDSSTLTVTWSYDFITGLATLMLGNTSVNFEYYAQAQIGVPVLLAQTTQDIGGTVMSTVNAGGSLIGGIVSAITGNPGSGISGMVGAASGVASAVDSFMPQVRSIGTDGSYSNFVYNGCLMAEFAYLVDEDNADRGRPLCKVGTISSYPGYLVISDPDISMASTAEEQTIIKDYMTGGFFYE